VVAQLAAFGQVTPGQEALGVFLNAIAPLVGTDQRPFLADLVTRYSMIVPESHYSSVMSSSDKLDTSSNRNSGGVPWELGCPPARRATDPEPKNRILSI
jgi:effector-associated domain 8 (EAD8)-containing protein